MRFGVDIGGTTVKIGLVKEYRVVDSYQIPTRKETLFQDICLSIKEYMQNHNIKEIKGIGFGIPGHVKGNYIYNMPNIGLKNIDIQAEVEKFFPHVFIQSNNDANVAALGEALYEGLTQSSYMITLGTGVGGGYVYNGKVVDGAHCACGEIGHIFVDYVHNYPCTCGLKGCLETVASATGIVRLAKEYSKDIKTNLNINDFTCKDVFDAARGKDELAVYVLDKVAMYIARGLATLAVAVDVETFYIGGGVSAGGDLFLDQIRRYFKEYCHYAVKDTKIKLAKLGNLAGMLGAAYII